MTYARFFLLGLLPISACATPQAVPVEIQGLEAFQQPCPNNPPVLSDAEALALATQLDAALALPTRAEQTRAIAEALEPIAQRDQQLRGCVLYERRRADGLLTLGARFNQQVRDVSREVN